MLWLWHHIKLSKSQTNEAKFLHLNGLYAALATDPDLVQVSETERPQVLQTEYVCTGSDYTFLFQQIGKFSFLLAPYQHANFITGKETIDSMGNITNDPNNPEHTLFYD